MGAGAGEGAATDGGLSNWNEASEVKKNQHEQIVEPNLSKQLKKMSCKKVTHGAAVTAGAWGDTETVGVEVGATLVCGACNEYIIVGYYFQILEMEISFLLYSRKDDKNDGNIKNIHNTANLSHLCWRCIWSSRPFTRCILTLPYFKNTVLV